MFKKRYTENMARKHKRVESQNHTFYFKYDDDLLHIYVRHLTTIDNALETFFNTSGKWNDERKRFENFSETHGLYWFWLNEEEKKVMIISCFRLFN
jgi:hypothetical protein